MRSAKVVSLTVRPLQVAHLCFEADGIIGPMTATLGSSVSAFDLSGLYDILRSASTTPLDPSRLYYDGEAIEAYTAASSLAALRAEAVKAMLTKAINARQNAFFSKYANIPAIVTQALNTYNPGYVNSKPYRLGTLAALAQAQSDALSAAYATEGLGQTSVVIATRSTLQSAGQSSGLSLQSGQDNSNSETTDVGTEVKLHVMPTGGASLAGGGFTGPDPVEETLQESTSYSTAKSQSTSSEYQQIVNTTLPYTVPYIAAQAQNERAQISLMDERFSQFMAGQNLSNLAQVLTNELASIDADVNRLQLLFLNTILLSPIAGTVTGLYKQPGEAVKAGEVVVRVENAANVLLVAVLVYRGPITLGAAVTVTTALFDAAGPATTITGSVVSARGLADDDTWEVVIQCANLDGAGQPILPFGYRFDYDDTTVAIG
jgi:biotin carboxyl carrier protein